MLHSFLAFFFKLIVCLRHQCYFLGIFKEKRANIPVISVGSIQIGGSGKTPICLFLAEALSNHISFGFVSRGYKSRAEKNREPILIDRLDSDLFGDEPCLIYSYFPKAPFAVGRDRLKGTSLIEKQGAKLALCDDGFQHRKLKKDLQIIALDAQDPFSGNAFFPKGKLRDFPSRLNEADLIIAFGQSSELLDLLKPFSTAPVIFAEKKVKGIFDKNKKEVTLKGKKVALFAGIADPSAFFKQFDPDSIVWQKSLPDHQEITEKQMSKFVVKAKSLKADYLLCTEKDWVKIKEFDVGIKLGYLKIEIKIKQGEELLFNRIRGICKLEKKLISGQTEGSYVEI